MVIQIESDVTLAPLTTFKIGGPAQFFCTVHSDSELKEAFAFAKEKGLRVFILGGGSNVLIADEGFPGLVVKIALSGLEYIDQGETVEVVVAGGEVWDEVVEASVKRGLSGIENLSGIPGTIGGAPVQNIGAYGVELADVLLWVEVFDPHTGSLKRLSRDDCMFGYRDSVFKHDGKHLVVIRIALTLKKGGTTNIAYRDLQAYFGVGEHKTPSAQAVREAVLAIRGKKFPDTVTIGTAGSFFKNPIVSRTQAAMLTKNFPDLPQFPTPDGHVKLSLAWIIDHVCNLKGLRVGGASVSPLQALVICNDNGATAAEVVELADTIKQQIRSATGIDIEPEVQYVHA